MKNIFIIYKRYYTVYKGKKQITITLAMLK